MAKMHPKELPSNIRGNPLRAAECKVYDALEAQLDDTFHVFYSSPWLGTTEYGEEKDGEADFTIAHVDHGMLVVEVKGGRVYIEDDTHQWHSVDRNGIDHKIKDPVNQARLGKHNLLKALSNRPEWQSQYINARHGIILCDTERPKHPLAPDMPLKIFAFSDDMSHLDSWVSARYGCRDGEQHPDWIKPMGLPGITALKAMLSDGIQLKVDLRAYLDSDVKRIEVLSEEQYGILEELEENPRMAIAGAAGTGKTVLAAHKAVLESKSGKATLFVCFNEPLASHLKSRFADVARVDVFTFHGLCEELATSAHLQLPPPQDKRKEYFEEKLPNLLVTALAQLPDKRYLAIIVDEGQDFADAWLESLELALEDDDQSTFYVFYDNNQQVMNRASNFMRSMNGARRRLRCNFRNTRRIFEVAARFYVGDGVVSVGPEGEKIWMVEARNYSMAATKLREILGFLIARTGIQAERIAVLCGSRKRAIELEAAGSIASYTLTNAVSPGQGAVVVDSVRRFKGLEADVVILFMLDDFVDNSELIYVATTRAKALLIVIGSEGANSVLVASESK